MLYLDTSVLVAVLTIEVETVRVQHWLKMQNPDEIVVSDWVGAEFYAAVSKKIRMNRLSDTGRDDVLRIFEDVISHYQTLRVTRGHFVEAGKLAARAEVGLRAGDALHLAIAAEQALILCTLDKGQAEAGPKLGIDTRLI